MLCSLACAAEPLPPIPRIFPPVGIKPDEATSKKLRGLVEELERDLKPFDPRGKDDAARSKPEAILFADVAIYPKAVRYALDYDEFYKPTDVADAEKLLSIGRARLKELQDKVAEPSWTKQRGLVVRGYISIVDDSVQPYGLNIPEDLDLSKTPPLYVWLHGRQERTLDLQFIAERAKNKGKFAADDAITVHPFGRYNNAFKFAGERDVLDVMFHVEKLYKTDPARRVLMGFSMGGAGCWHIGAHYPHLFCAMAPGAGFSESRRFLKIKDENLPPWYEQVLWQWYDVPNYTRNLFNLPVIAYSGEKDGQKQAADVMEAEFAKYGRKLNHIIGPGMGHDYDKESLEKIRAELKAITAKSIEKKKIWHIQTSSGIYGCYGPLNVRLSQQWQNAQLELQIDSNEYNITTTNIQDIQLEELEFMRPEKVRDEYKMTIDNKKFSINRFGGGRRIWLSRGAHSSESQDWTNYTNTLFELEAAAFWPRKNTYCFGNIDDAFRAKFLFVLPSGKSKNQNLQAWLDRELDYQTSRWRRTFRGDVQIVKDVDLTEMQKLHYNLILWGDRDSNSIIREIEDMKIKYPNGWKEAQLKHAQNNLILIGIAPNPFMYEFGAGAPFSFIDHARTPLARYVVYNSGPTFRDEHDRNNANQTPKLPDWAVIDVTTPGDAKSPGKIVTAGFFDNDWKYVDPAKQQAEFEARQKQK